MITLSISDEFNPNKVHLKDLAPTLRPFGISYRTTLKWYSQTDLILV